ncbi:MAG: tol-pal system-associated acyl-CoA thioesterase [Chromatiaceae bacterium]|nr:tol-pal system-associated acyl-CoA thioesterase [Gammaproteobacteria bacterium]MCP5312982.1 tol-pal system-associated acyl-CoA thioesterase [Chromatiaceae bacterium]
MSGFEWPVRVYYEDTDAGGVVYYANYLKFLERARTEWLRDLGFEQERLMRDAGILFAVRRVEIDYLLPARFDDALVVEAAIAELGRASFTFRQRIVRAPDTLLSTATVTVVCLDKDRFRPTAIPTDIHEKISHAQH